MRVEDATSDLTPTNAASSGVTLDRKTLKTLTRRTLGLAARAVSIRQAPHMATVGGVEGVKLEDQVLITDSGPITLSRYPFEDTLLSRET